MCLSPLCSTSLFYWYLFLCALPHSFSYSSVHLLHPIFCSQNCLSALHQKGWELWTCQRQDIKATTGQPQLWGCPKSAFWHNKLPREGRVSFKQKQKLNQTKCNGSPKPKNSSGDQGTEWGKAFTQLSSYPEVPAEEAPQEAPSTSQAQSVLHHLCSNPSAPLQCFWDPRSWSRLIPAVSQQICWSCSLPASFLFSPTLAATACSVWIPVNHAQRNECLPPLFRKFTLK